jgi:hypothetical protein
MNSLFALILFMSPVSFGADKAPYTDWHQCKSWTTSEWDLYLSNMLKFYVVGSEPQGLISSQPSPSDYLGTLNQTLRDAQDYCKNQVAQLGLNRCLDRIMGFSSQFAGGGKGMFSARMTDEEYYASQPPGVMELPPEFAKAPNGLPKNWREIAKKNGWKWALFDSGTSSQTRLVMYIPGKVYDRMLVYYTFDSENHDPTTFESVQMQGIENRSDNGLPKYFFKSWGFHPPDGLPQPQVSGGRCVSCHVSGPRAIVPRTHSKYDPTITPELGGVASIDELNDLMVRKKPLDYSPYYDLKYFPSHMQVGSNHQCIECHNGKQRNSLSFSVTQFGEFNFMNVDRKVDTERTMPKQPWAEWTSRERQKAATELDWEFRTKLGAWLSEKKCDASKPADTSPTPIAQ